MARYIFTYCFFFFFLLSSNQAQALFNLEVPANLPTCEEAPNDPNCIPIYTLPLFCNNDISATFTLTLDDETFDLLFIADFPNDDSPIKKPRFYVEDGNATGKNDLFITSLTCQDSGSGQSCRGTISVEKAEKLEQRFNFDSAAVGVSLRKGKDKSICTGKLVEDSDVIAAHNFLDRTYCTFTAFEDGYSGEGYFDPMGYSADGEPWFFMRLLGFPTKTYTRGCVLSDSGYYRMILSFKTYASSKGDDDIYKKLDSESQEQFDLRELNYSHDLWRLLAAQQDLSLLSDRSLGTIGRQVSSPSSSSYRKSTNSSRARSRRGAKKKKRKKSKRKSKTLSISSTSGKESVFNYLAFDPKGYARIYLAPDCKGDVISKAYGYISCGASDPNRSCSSFTAQDSSHSGRLCKQTEAVGITLFLIRLKGLDVGEYTVCLDATALDTKIAVTAGTSFSSGSLQITDNSTVANEIAHFAYFNGSLENVSTIGITSATSCTNYLMELNLS